MIEICTNVRKTVKKTVVFSAKFCVFIFRAFTFKNFQKDFLYVHKYHLNNIYSSDGQKRTVYIKTFVLVKRYFSE